jgi:hypothetical protein
MDTPKSNIQALIWKNIGCSASLSKTLLIDIPNIKEYQK